MGASDNCTPQILDVLDGPDPRPAGSNPAAENGLKGPVRRDLILVATCDSCYVDSDVPGERTLGKWDKAGCRAT